MQLTKAHRSFEAHRQPHPLFACLLALCLLGLMGFCAGRTEAADTHHVLPVPSEKITLGVPEHVLAAGREAAVSGPVGGESYSAMTVAPGETVGEAGHLWVAETDRVDEFDAFTGAWELQLEHVGSNDTDIKYGVAVGSSTGEREEYVTGGGSAAVSVFGADGKLQAEWTGAHTPQGSFSDGATNEMRMGVAVDESGLMGDWASGDVLVGTNNDGGLGAVDVFKPEAALKGNEPASVAAQLTGTCENAGETATGAGACPASASKKVVRFPEPEDATPLGLAVDRATGDLLVTDGSLVDVFKPTMLGQYEFVRQIVGIPGHVFTPPIPYVSLGGLGVSAGGGEEDGDFYIAEVRNDGEIVYEFNSRFEYVGSLTGTPAGSFHELRSLAVDPAGSALDDPASGDVFVGDQRSEGRVGEEPGAVDAFGADLVIPNVTTAAASQVTTAGAVLNGGVNPLEAGELTRCAFEYGTSTAYGTSVPCAQSAGQVGDGDSPVPVSAQIPAAGALSLQPDTTYDYRLVAANGNGENTGLGIEDEGSFTTPGPGIREQSVSDVASSSATLNASIAPHNGSESLSHGARESWFFQYGTQPCGAEVAGSPCGSMPAPPGSSLGEGEAPMPVSLHVQGLMQGTIYHYRVIAVSEPAAGVVEDFPSAEGTFTTQVPGSFSLLDARAWEMVSPARKEGALIQAPGIPWGTTKAAADGEAMTFLTDVPTEKGVVGYANEQQLLSVRGADGWSAQDLGLPHNGEVGVEDETAPEFRFFSEDLSRAVVQPYGLFAPCHDTEGAPRPCLSEHASEQTAFLANLSGDVVSDFMPLVTACPGEGEPCPPAVAEAANAREDVVFGRHGQNSGEECPPERTCGPFFDSASPNTQHIVFRQYAAQLTEETAPEGGLYEYNAQAPPSQQLQLISVLPGGGSFDVEGSYLGGGGAGETASGLGEDARHAISDEGTRVFWTSGGASGSELLYMRDVPAKETIQIGFGPAEFQGASADGSRVFFTKEGVSGSLLSGSLFECEIGEALECNPTRLGEAPPNSGAIIGASEDGSYVYWVAADHNLFLDHYEGGSWQRTLIAALSAEDVLDWARGENDVQQLTARVSPDGRFLAFMSAAEVVSYDNRDARSGHPDEELYLYHAAAAGGESASLSCVSCDPTGARPLGVEGGGEVVDEGGGEYQRWEGSGAWLSADVPGYESLEQQVGRYQPRYLSDSGRVFFDSDDALVPRDVNGTWDVYEWEPQGVGGCGGPGSSSGGVVFKPARGYTAQGQEGEEAAGCVGLVSSGESTRESVLLDASETGGDVFFMTTAKLAPQDFDDAYDIYDAHECTSASPCVSQPTSPLACTTAEACRAAPEAQPSIYGAPPSATFNGLGNLAPPMTVTPKKATNCKKGQVRDKHGECVKKKSKKKGKTRKKSKQKRGESTARGRRR